MMLRSYDSGNSGNAGISNMILLSLAIHMILISVLLFTLPASKRHLTFGPIYDVQLIGSDLVLSDKQAASPSGDILQSQDSRHTAIMKKQISDTAVTPVKKEETNKVNIEKAVSAIKQRELALPNAPNSIVAKPGQKAAAAGGVKYGSSQISSALNAYKAATYAIVKKNFSIPPALLPRVNVTAIIEVKIYRDGTPDAANFEKRSGNRYFDDAALKAVKKVTQFPAFPEAMKENSIIIGFIFHSAELR